jgi:soluble lytic murein transglycosylase-like protein
MTLGLQRADVQRLINPPVRPRSLSLPGGQSLASMLPGRGTFASVLSRVQGRPAVASPSQARPTSVSNSRARMANASTAFFGASPANALQANKLSKTGAQGATGLDAYKDLVKAAANKYGLDPSLLAAVAQTESGFNPRAQSGAGAKGLMQLMDGTARGLGISDSFDPAQSLDGGARFLSGLLKQFNGDVRLALAAYNAGPAAVKKYGGIPPYQETQRYVPKVLGQADQFRRIFAANLPALESS